MGCLLGARVDGDDRRVTWQGRITRVAALPIGVEWDDFQSLAADPAVKQRAAAIRAAVGTPYFLLAVDRLDYTKGVLERLRAYDVLLEMHPECRGRVTLVQIGVPTREGARDYALLRQQIEAEVGRLSQLYGTDSQRPVHYVARAVNRTKLAAYYLAADVAVVTPLRDGLNLVAKEFVATRADGDGVLVLSPFAGAAVDLDGALLANPYEPSVLAEALNKALCLEPGERRQRMDHLRAQVVQRDLRWWWSAFQRAWEEALKPGNATAPAAR